ncbi:MAG: glycosyltransferase family 4 protein [Gemmatimonadaceae bacterium]
MTTPLRFCFPTTFYPPYSFGGDAVATQRLARALVNRGHHVTVVHDIDAYNTLHDGPAPPAPVRNDGVEVIAIESGAAPLSLLLTQQTGRPTLNARKLGEILGDGRFDVINFQNPSLVGGPGLLSYGGVATRLYMAHDHWLVCPTHVLRRHNRELCDHRECFRCQLHYRRPPQLWRWTSYLNDQLRHIHAFIAMSEFSRDKHYEFGFPRVMEVMPNFLPDPDPPATIATPEAISPPPHARPYFLFVGRLEKIKGLDQVIPLFRQYPDADLLIAGDGNHAGALRSLADGNEQVIFLGRIPLEDLKRYYRRAVATIVPSVCYETFGIIIIESFKERTPVIARRLGPFPEIMRQSDGGELFETDAELLSAMRRLQSDPAYREEKACSAYRAYVDLWSESVVVPRYLDIVARART